MSTVRQAFDDFMKGLELTEAEQSNVSRQQNDLRERIRGRLGVQRDVIVGSYSRGTAIRPLHDVDLFFELDPRDHGGRRNQEPRLLLEDVQRALRECYPSPGPATRIQGRSVNIQFSSTGIGYDVIPAFRVATAQAGAADVYEIPDRRRQSWIKTNPELHRMRCSEANRRAGGMLNRLIKAAKHWKRSHPDKNGDSPIRSFHLEVMAYEAFNQKPSDERRGLRDLFEFLASRIMSRCPDPVGLGPDIDAELSGTERALAREALQRAAQLAGDAVRAEELGHDEEARKRWRSLLGPAFSS